MGRSNIFSLDQIYRKQVVGTWSKIPEVFRYVNSLAVPPSPAGTDFGYFMGGWAECCPYLTPFSTVDRLDFSNDTDNMVTKAALTTVKSYMRGYSSFTHGYAAGGSAPSIPSVRTSTIDRIDYANDTAAQTAKGPLETAVSSNCVGLHNTEYGYTLGGSSSPSVSHTSYNQRLEFANDTTTTAPKGNLSQAKRFGAGAGNQSYGYYSGGLNPSRISTVERLDYSSDTTTMAPKGPLSRVVSEHDAAGNADYGYHAGGWDPGSPYATTNDRIDYSNDTATALVRGILGYPGRHGPTATGNTSYGYWTGGYGNTTNSYRLDYSSDTTTMSVKGKRTTFSQNGAGVSSRANAMPLTSSTDIVPATSSEVSSTPQGTDFGYFGGGYTSPSPVSTVDRVDYSNDTATAAVKGPLHYSQYGGTATGNASYGYWGGGSNPSGDNLTLVSRFDYAADTSTAVSKGNLAAGRGYLSGAGNVSYGYYGAGFKPGPSPSTTVQRIDFGNDTTTAATKGPINQSVSYIGSTGTQSYGYWAGGGMPDVSTISRVDYASDTGTASPKGPLSAARRGQGATGNASYAYFAGGSGGSPWVSSIDRLDYASDTSTASPKGNRSGQRFVGQGGTGDQSYGYNAGGGTPMSSIMDRIDYSNDTATAATKGPLSAQRNLAGAISSRDYATPTTSSTSKTVDEGAHGYTTYSGGPSMGYATGSGTYVQRIDYANDTATAPTKGPLSAIASYHSAVSSTTHGYTFGGPPGPGNSRLQRIDYSNDTATAPTVANLAQPVYRTYSGMGNKTYGYQSGGQRPSTTGTSNIDRIEYANDTSTGLQKGNLASSRYLQTATGNLSYGYVCGGSPPFQNNSLVQRVDYGNDTATASPKGPLHQGSRKLSSAGTADYGYVAGGSDPELSSTTRIDYSNDTATSVEKGSMTRTRRNFGGMSSPAYAYYTAGAMPYPQPALTSTDRLDYANDTATASPKGPLSAGMSYFSAASPQDIGGSLGSTNFIPRIRWVDNATEITAGTPYGYSAGGSAPARPVDTVVQRIDFSNDTANAVGKGSLPSVSPAPAPGAGKDMCGALGNTNFAYFAGGNTWLGTTSEVSRLDYANDSTDCVSKGPLSVAAKSVGATGNTNFGYVVGGFPGGSFSNVQRIDYSNDTVAASLKGPLTQSTSTSAGAGTLDFGYFSGGNSPGNPGAKTFIQRIEYSNDTANTSPKGNLATQTERHGNTGNKNFGYHSGGYNGSSYTSIVQRTTYSNDTATASPKGTLTVNNAQFGATGNQTGGYIMGGDRSGYTSTIEKIDYTNDTATATTKGYLLRNVYSNSSTSGQINGFEAIAAPVQPPFPFPVQLPAPTDFGYFTGGDFSVYTRSSTERIEYANDTATATPKGNLTVALFSPWSGASSVSHGFMGGGYSPAIPSPGRTSQIQRLDYANDTNNFENTANLTYYTTGAASTGNKNFGYWWGGRNDTYSPQYLSFVNRIAYASSTVTDMPKSTEIGNQRAAVGNANYGYWTGGQKTPPPYIVSWVWRLDYANDTAAPAQKGSLDRSIRDHIAAGNSNFGYVFGGTPDTSKTCRIDYANDTATAAPKGDLAQNSTYGSGATGNKNFGYITYGRTISARGLIKMDYSNDTTTTDMGNIFPIESYYKAGMSAAYNGFG